ncbi:MAG: ATP-grasp domain-containing protein [Chloroflexi bacterium]|nr:ATP-grasp domain-containing protein [Chloroflexota bacterium]
MDSQKRLILLASASSYRAGDFEKAAKRLGIEVALGMDVPAPLAHTYHCSLPLDYLDTDRSSQAIAEWAEKNPAQVILSADDSATVLAAEASHALGLRHNSPEAAEAAQDKYIMRQLFAKANVPSPNFRLYSLSDDPEDIADELMGAPGDTGGSESKNDPRSSLPIRVHPRSDSSRPLTFPVVLKPRRLSGSRGVIRADSPMDFIVAHKRLQPILEKTGANDFLVEEFIPGFEVALEGILDNGVLKVLALFDKPDPLDGPYFEETIYVTPSRLPAETQQAIFDCAARAAAALGLREGPVHAELRVNDLGPSTSLRASPVMVELAGRSIGGLCSRTLRFGTDMSLEELILRQAFGMEIESAPHENRAGGVMMIPIPRGGMFLGCGGIEEAMAVPGIESVEITAKVNYPIVPLPEGDSYLGFIFARGSMPDEVEAALREAHRRLRFEIAPEISVMEARR